MQSPSTAPPPGMAAHPRVPLSTLPASTSNRQAYPIKQTQKSVQLSNDFKGAPVKRVNLDSPKAILQPITPIIQWSSHHHPKFVELMKSAAVAHFTHSNPNSPSDTTTSEWSIPIQCLNVNLKGINKHFYRPTFVTSAQMELKILPSFVHHRSPGKYSGSPSKPSLRPTRIWCATFCVPFTYAFGGAFFRSFPQKNKVCLKLLVFKK
jgi:hypothetical protein